MEKINLNNENEKSNSIFTTKREIKHAFVTGATGLLGNNLVRALVNRGIKVTGLVRILTLPSYEWNVTKMQKNSFQI